MISVITYSTKRFNLLNRVTFSIFAILVLTTCISKKAFESHRIFARPISEVLTNSDSIKQILGQPDSVFISINNQSTNLVYKNILLFDTNLVFEEVLFSYSKKGNGLFQISSSYTGESFDCLDRFLYLRINDRKKLVNNKDRAQFVYYGKKVVVRNVKDKGGVGGAIYIDFNR